MIPPAHKTPVQLFTNPVRYMVPRFQRHYVWNETYQWQPLWDDICDTANRMYRSPEDADAADDPDKTKSDHKHFFGAVVLKQLPHDVGEPESRLVVDGQQRLSTMQIAMFAIRRSLRNFAQLHKVHASSATEWEDYLADLTKNPDKSRFMQDDRCKVVPFKEDDRNAFIELSSVPPNGGPGHPMRLCYDFFARASLKYLEKHKDDLDGRLIALMGGLTEGLQVVTINLEKEENEYLIFEALNARGHPLTEWDKARNHFLYRASPTGDSRTEGSFYTKYLERFDTDKWWTTHVYRPRFSGTNVELLLNYWLIIQHSQHVPSHRAYYWFRKLADKRPDAPSLAESFGRYADLFRSIEEEPTDHDGIEARFFYRRRVLRLVVVVPVLMKVYDLLREQEQREECVRLIDSWLVRTRLCGYNASGDDKLFMGILQRLNGLSDGTHRVPKATVLGVLFEELEGSRAGWPDDERVDYEIKTRHMYWKDSTRVRMTLEAIEDALTPSAAGKQAIKTGLWVEHVMPRGWRENWPLPDGAGQDTVLQRDHLLETLGNLTLTTSKLNIDLSNRPWTEKRKILAGFDNLFLNKRLLEDTEGRVWDEHAIYTRSEKLARLICQIWPHSGRLRQEAGLN